MAYEEIRTGIVAIEHGGTGATTAEQARINLGIEDTTVSFPISVANGGTGATTAANARKNLGVYGSGENSGLPEYPTTQGIYRVTGQAIFSGTNAPTTNWGCLIIIGHGYHRHIFLDGTNVWYGNSTDTVACPTAWTKVATDSNAVMKAGDTMTGNLSIQGESWPSLYLLPTKNSTGFQSVVEGSFSGATSISAWDDNTGNNRRILEVRNSTLSSSVNDAIKLRTATNNTWNEYRVFHSGMTTGIPVANGGTGATTAADALTNLGALAKSGDVLDIKSSQYMPNEGKYGIHMHNSDIVGINGLFMADSANSNGEGIFYKRDDNENYDGLIMRNGIAYILPNIDPTLSGSDTLTGKKAIFTENSTIPVANGGTGKTTLKEARALFTNLGTNPVALANDTPAYWAANHPGLTNSFYSGTNTITDKPSNYGAVISSIYGSDVFQLWHVQPQGELYMRGGNASEDWANNKSWTKILSELDVVNNTEKGGLGWTSVANGKGKIPNMNTLAYWDGSYNGATSNIVKLGTVTTGTWNASTIGVAYGGTGCTTAQNAANAFINALETGASTPVDDDYMITQYVNGGTTTTRYVRRKMSTVYNYFANKMIIYSTSTPAYAAGKIWLKPV